MEQKMENRYHILFYNYCDYRCEKCPFIKKCPLYQNELKPKREVFQIEELFKAPLKLDEADSEKPEKLDFSASEKSAKRKYRSYRDLGILEVNSETDDDENEEQEESNYIVDRFSTEVNDIADDEFDEDEYYDDNYYDDDRYEYDDYEDDEEFDDEINSTESFQNLFPRFLLPGEKITDSQNEDKEDEYDYDEDELDPEEELKFNRMDAIIEKMDVFKWANEYMNESFVFMDSVPFFDISQTGITEAFTDLECYCTLLPDKLYRTLMSLEDLNEEPREFYLIDAYLSSHTVYKSIYRSLAALEVFRNSELGDLNDILHLEKLLIQVREELKRYFPFEMMIFIIYIYSKRFPEYFEQTTLEEVQTA